MWLILLRIALAPRPTSAFGTKISLVHTYIIRSRFPRPATGLLDPAIMICSRTRYQPLKQPGLEHQKEVLNDTHAAAMLGLAWFKWPRKSVYFKHGSIGAYEK